MSDKDEHASATGARGDVLADDVTALGEGTAAMALQEEFVAAIARALPDSMKRRYGTG